MQSVVFYVVAAEVVCCFVTSYRVIVFHARLSGLLSDAKVFPRNERLGAVQRSLTPGDFAVARVLVCGGRRDVLSWFCVASRSLRLRARVSMEFVQLSHLKRFVCFFSRTRLGFGMFMDRSRRHLRTECARFKLKRRWPLDLL